MISCTPGGDVSIIARRMAGSWTVSRSGASKYKAPCSRRCPAGISRRSGTTRCRRGVAEFATLQRALKNSRMGGETNTQNFALCGVHLDPTENGLKRRRHDQGQACDARDTDGEFDQDTLQGVPAITVPTPAIANNPENAGTVRGRVAAGFRTELLQVKAGNAVLVTKLAEGQFLPYKQLRPMDSGGP